MVSGLKKLNIYCVTPPPPKKNTSYININDLFKTVKQYHSSFRLFRFRTTISTVFSSCLSSPVIINLVLFYTYYLQNFFDLKAKSKPTLSPSNV